MSLHEVVAESYAFLAVKAFKEAMYLPTLRYAREISLARLQSNNLRGTHDAGNRSSWILEKVDGNN